MAIVLVLCSYQEIIEEGVVILSKTADYVAIHPSRKNHVRATALRKGLPDPEFEMVAINTSIG